MKQFLLCSLIIIATLTAGAQTPTPKSSPSYSPEKCTAGYYVRDSVAIHLPGAKPKYDAIKASQKKLDSIREAQIPATDKLLTAQSDSVKSRTPAGKNEIAVAKKQISILKLDSMAEIDNIRKQYVLLGPTYKIVDHKADSIGKARGMSQVRESNDNSAMICPTDQMLMIDITNDISVSLGMKPRLLRVGTFNTDSLLRLMPGYAKLADSTVAEMNVFNNELAKKDAEIAKMQHELDSVRPTLSKKKVRDREEEIAMKQEDRDIYRGNELYKVDLRDSLRVSSYNRKFRAAASSAAKERSCLKYYDQSVAHDYWTTDEAEFIDLNAAIARELGL